MSKEREKNDFERSIDRLEKLVDNMESGEASLEQNLSWFEEGMDLIKQTRFEAKNSIFTQNC